MKKRKIKKNRMQILIEMKIIITEIVKMLKIFQTKLLETNRKINNKVRTVI
jgi:hypothetical protein